MIWTNKIIRTAFADRLRSIDRQRLHPLDVQREQFAILMRGGGDYMQRFGAIRSVEQFQQTVPVVDYDAMAPWVERIRHGEGGSLWSGSKTCWFAKSSGTTGTASKFIPITKQYLNNCHYRGGRDAMAVFCDNFPTSTALSGKALTLGGSSKIDCDAGLRSGDLSAILIDNAPSWLSLIREPARSVALIPDFNEKIEAICRATVDKNVTSFAGVPSWNLVLMNKVLEVTGKSSLRDVWPNLGLFIHGGVAFSPYRAEFERIIPSDEMHYMETYNASEGFFGIQDDPTDYSMLLMLDYEIFYEFLPLSRIDDPSAAVTLEGVQLGVNYAMIISCSGGLWRYMIGDTVEFTSTSPYKIRITGRTKHFINVFGEEVIIDNAERALHSACVATGAVVAEYTAGPIFMEGQKKGAHEWLVEFSTMPSSVERFTKELDTALQRLNSDYAAKRYHDATLSMPKVVVAPGGTFYKWLQGRGKVGGQNKVPRLSGSRDYLDQLSQLL